MSLIKPLHCPVHFAAKLPSGYGPLQFLHPLDCLAQFVAKLPGVFAQKQPKFQNVNTRPCSLQKFRKNLGV